MVLLAYVRKKAFQRALQARLISYGNPPKAKIEGKSVSCGYVNGEDRGENPMRPPKMTFDPYYWLRDDERNDPEVLRYL